MDKEKITVSVQMPVKMYDGKRNTVIPDDVLKNLIDNVKDGRCFGTLEHKAEHRLSDAAFKVTETSFNGCDKISADIETIVTPEGKMFKELFNGNPELFDFEVNGFYHTENNEETGEEDIVIDRIVSIDAVVKKR